MTLRNCKAKIALKTLAFGKKQNEFKLKNIPYSPNFAYHGTLTSNMQY